MSAKGRSIQCKEWLQATNEECLLESLSVIPTGACCLYGRSSRHAANRQQAHKLGFAEIKQHEPAPYAA